MKCLQPVVILSFCLLLSFANAQTKVPYNQLKPIGSYEKSWITVQWGYVDDDDTTMYWNVTGATNGWVSVGWSEAGEKMDDGDYVVGFYSDGADFYDIPTISDRFSTTYERPPVDPTTQDIEIFDGYQENGFTNIFFKRKMDTGDVNDFPIRDGLCELLVAIGKDDLFDYHLERSHVTINLVTNTVQRKSRDGWDGDSVGHYKTNDDDDFEIEWGFTGEGDDEYIVWKVKAKTTGWFAFAISEDRFMPKSDFVVMFVEDIDSSKHGWVSDRYIDDQYTRPKSDDIQDLELLYADQVGDYSYMSVARKVKTEDKQDRDINDDDEYLLWAIGYNDQFDLHHKNGWAPVNWRTGDVSDGDNLPLKWIHGMLMIFAWFLVGIISFGLCRYCKSLQGAAWLYVHLVLMLVTVIFTIIAFVLIVVSVSVENEDHFQSYHAIAGLIIVICTIVQPLIISIAKFPPGSLLLKGKAVPMILAMAQHRFFGFLMLVFALVNIGTGLDLYHAHTGLWVCFGIWIGITVVYWFIHEMMMILPGFNEVVGKMGGPKNIFKDFYAFLLFSLQLLYFTLSVMIFVVMIVLFAVYEDTSEYGSQRSASHY